MSIKEETDRFTGAKVSWTMDRMGLSPGTERRLRLAPHLVERDGVKRAFIVLSHEGRSMICPDVPLDGTLTLATATSRISLRPTDAWLLLFGPPGNAASELRGGDAEILPAGLQELFAVDFKLARTLLPYTIGELRAFEADVEEIMPFLDNTDIALRIATSSVRLDVSLGESGLVYLRRFFEVTGGFTFARPTVAASSESSCFPGSAEVWVPGGRVPISLMVPGQQVLSWRDGRLFTQTVTRVLCHPPCTTVSVLLDGVERALEGTGNHRVLAGQKGWCRLDALVQGDVVQSAEGGLRVVHSVLRNSEPRPVYNLYTTGDHNFIVDGLVCHNFSKLRLLRTAVHRILVDPWYAGVHGAKASSVVSDGVF